MSIVIRHATVRIRNREIEIVGRLDGVDPALVDERVRLYNKAKPGEYSVEHHEDFSTFTISNAAFADVRGPKNGPPADVASEDIYIEGSSIMERLLMVVLGQTWPKVSAKAACERVAWFCR